MHDGASTWKTKLTVNASVALRASSAQDGQRAVGGGFTGPGPAHARNATKTRVRELRTRTMLRAQTLNDFEQMKASVLFGEDDVKYLRMSQDVVKDQVEAILDVWYGFVGSNPHLLASFTGKSDGKPLGDYLGAVRKRFGQWILDTTRAEYDQARPMIAATSCTPASLLRRRAATLGPR